jgi:hypothetical protein
MGVSLQTRDHLSGSGGTAPKFYIIMVAALEDISYKCILLCACLGVIHILGAVEGTLGLWVAGL